MKVLRGTFREKTEKSIRADAPTAPRRQTESPELVKMAAGGDFAAFGELYDIYLDRIFRYVFYQVRDKMTAEDITEEVFLKAWKAIETCKGREKTFSAWLYRIAHNHLVNTVRRQQRFTPIEKVEVVDSRQGIADEVENQELLKVLDCLPENQKQIILLKFIDGLGNREIGKIVGKSEGAVRVAQMRALAALRKHLRHDAEGGV